jgi:PKD repeat protein
MKFPGNYVHLHHFQSLFFSFFYKNIYLKPFKQLTKSALLFSLILYHNPILSQIFPNDWDYTITGLNHTILIPGNSIIVDGLPISIGDYVGVFFNDLSGNPACGGYIIYNGQDNIIPAWGDDVLTPEKEGFIVNEEFQWKVFRPNDGITFPLNAVYQIGVNTPDSGFFVNDGISVIQSLNNYVLNYLSFAVSGFVQYQPNSNPVSNHQINIEGVDTLLVPQIIVFTDISGNYNATLMVPDLAGFQIVVSTFGDCNPSIEYQEIIPVAINPGIANFLICNNEVVIPCPVNFSYSQINQSVNTYQFLPTEGSDAIFFSWNFGDGTFSNEFSPTHQFADTGYYSVCLNATFTDGCSSTFCDSIYSDSNYCAAIFTAFQSPMLCDPFGIAYQMNDLSISTDSIISWQWDFGEGSTGNLQNSVNCFSDSGLFQVCLTISTSSGCQNSYCNWIQISDTLNTSCNSEFTVTNTLTGIQFFDSSSGNTDYWNWSFGDGSTSYEQNPFHTFSQAGWFNVCLTISNLLGCESSFCDSVYYDPITECSANFSYQFDSISGCEGCFSFTNLSAPISGSQFLWDFGDGSTSALLNPDHTFMQSGYYEVCLYMTSTNGCYDIYCNQVNVEMTVQGFVLSGSVIAGNNPVSNGTAIVMNSNGVYYSTSIQNGFYSFSQIPSGIYIVYGIPSNNLYPNFAPTYFPESLFWTQATQINLSTDITNANITLVEFPVQTGGIGTISGWLSWNLLNSTNTFKSFIDNSVDSIPIFLFDLNENPIAYTTTGEQGYFLFQNLPFGVYKIVAEMPGYNSVPVIVTIEPGHFSITNITLVINGLSIALGIDYASDADERFVIFPNPVSSVINIFFNTYINEGRIKIISFEGRILFEKSISDIESNVLRFDISYLKKGTYFLQINSLRDIVVLPFLKE